MKYRFLFLLLSISNLVIAQVVIKGTVFIDKKPIEGAAVYFNNTMVGTTTNNNGEFSFKIKEGQYQLIVSYLGYKKINYNLNTTLFKDNLRFNLIEEENVLDEIIIKKTVYDDEWKYNLISFEREFIGISNLSKKCKIQNPKVLHFEYNPKTNILEAFARKPLIIKHKDLGYLITYDLVSFVKTGNYVTVVGYSRYENLKGSKRKKREWKKNRLEAYNGSRVHFLKSVLNNKTESEGFIINQFKRVPNPERPSEEEIKKARELIKLSMPNVDYFKKIEVPRTALDSALLVSKKIRLPKFRDYLYKSKLTSKDLLRNKNGQYFLNFKDNLSIVYTKELEEKAYILRNAFSKIREPLPQTSSFIPLKMPLQLDKLGILINPLDVLYEGYWSYEKLANMLPLDYEPF
jgi:hypothetical protein